jgi:epsilon-lactone hydrolase
MASAELHKLVSTLRGAKIAGEANIEQTRAGWEKFAASFVPAADITFEPATARGVPAEWVNTPDSDSSRVVLYFHGGGYTIGSIASYRSYTGRLARASCARLLSVGYRLAPEHPFPAAVEDAVASYHWLLDQGIAPDRIAAVGDSAGGGLALSMAIALRDAGVPGPAAIVAVGPSTDLAKEGASIKERAHLDPIVNHESSMAHALRYVGANGDLKHPLASPLYADLHGLPPLLILVGTHEALFDDSSRFAAKAQQAGVDVQFDVWEEMIHVWPFFADILPEGRQAIDSMGAYIRTRIP